MDTITIAEKYDTEKKEYASTETAVASLYKEPQPVVVASTNSTKSTKKQRQNLQEK